MQTPTCFGNEMLSSGSLQEQHKFQSKYWSSSLVSLDILMIPVRVINTWIGMLDVFL